MQIKLEADHVAQDVVEKALQDARRPGLQDCRTKDLKTDGRQKRWKRKWGKLNCCWLVRQMVDISPAGWAPRICLQGKQIYP